MRNLAINVRCNSTLSGTTSKQSVQREEEKNLSNTVFVASYVDFS